MIANYHTHTARCNHAVGTEREYIERAIEGGLQTLGFSDHAPYGFEGTDHVSGFRMLPPELPEYMSTLRALREEYRDRIDLRLGVEAEYYPKYFTALLERLRAQGVEYIILGQHLLDNEIDAWYVGRPTEDAALLTAYVDQCIAAMETGSFTYMAHPDIFNFVGDREVYARENRRLCRAAIANNLPLEINMLGIRDHRHYPNEDFWRIAGEEGVAVILGCDAHTPMDAYDPESEQTALELVEKYGLKLLQTVEFKPI